MPLQISGGAAFLAALLPPGNLAAEIGALRRGLYRGFGVPGAFPFPCAAPLAWFPSPPGPAALEAAARAAPRLFDRYAAYGGFLFLAPGAPEDFGALGTEGDAEEPPAELPGAVPAGRGFPLARFPDAAGAEAALRILPPPPRVSFRTFEAVLLRVGFGEAPFEALAWETEAALRYPVRVPNPRNARIHPRG